MNQCERVLQYMIDNGGISSVEAFHELGCTRLGSRIHDLRKRGHCITDVYVDALNRHGDKVRYKRYTLDVPR